MTNSGSGWVDIGVNLTNQRFEKDWQQVIEQALTAGVSQQLVTGTCLQESQQASALVEQASKHWPNVLFSTAGVHPHDAKQWGEDHAAKLTELLQKPWVKAVGEAGLDFNRDFSPRPVQERVFAEQLALAATLQLPLFMHERDAHERFAGIYSEHADQLTAGGVVHCFTSSEAALKHYLDQGLHIGITGWVCDERRGGELQRLVKLIPADRLLLETDAPYLLPRDMRPRPKSNRNVPAYLPHIGERVAALRGDDLAELAEVTTANARRLFRLPSPPAPLPEGEGSKK